MSKLSPRDAMMAKYLAQAAKSKHENRMVFNHICIRVEDLDAAVSLFRESFGIDGFLSPGGEVTSAIEVEGARMNKISNKVTPGIPVELIEIEDSHAASGF